MKVFAQHAGIRQLSHCSNSRKSSITAVVADFTSCLFTRQKRWNCFYAHNIAKQQKGVRLLDVTAMKFDWNPMSPLVFIPKCLFLFRYSRKKGSLYLVVNKGIKNDDSSSLGGVGGGVKEEETVYRNKVSVLSNYQNMWYITIKEQGSVAQGEEQVVLLLKVCRLELGSIHVEVFMLKTLCPRCLVWMWLNSGWWVRGAQWQPQGSCGYTCSSPSPVCGKSLQNKRLFLK